MSRDAAAVDLDDDGSVAHLKSLIEEAARVAGKIALRSPSSAVLNRPSPSGTAAHTVVDAPYVRWVIRARRMRNRYFHGDLFADPAFDMLLDLYAARLEGKRVAISSLCIAAAVPATTALRWIKALTARGMFIRSADPRDARRVYIDLSDEAAHAAECYFSDVQRAAAELKGYRPRRGDAGRC